MLESIKGTVDRNEDAFDKYLSATSQVFEEKLCYDANVMIKGLLAKG